MAAQSASDADAEWIEIADDSGYVVQVEEGESAAEVLANSDAVDARETKNLSGEAFNGAVADIDRSQARQLRKDPRVVSVGRNKVYTVNSRDLLSFVGPNAATAPAEDYSAQPQQLFGAWTGLTSANSRSIPATPRLPTDPELTSTSLTLVSTWTTRTSGTGSGSPPT